MLKLGIGVLLVVMVPVGPATAQVELSPGNLHNQSRGMGVGAGPDPLVGPLELPPGPTQEVPLPRKKLSAVDRRFLSRFLGQVELTAALSRVAAEGTEHDGVRALASDSVENHLLIGARMRTLAGQGGMRIPAPSQAPVRRLARLEGERLDREYVDAIIRSHRRIVGAFQRHIVASRDAEVRRVASLALPILQTELSEALRLRSELSRRRGAGG